VSEPAIAGRQDLALRRLRITVAAWLLAFLGFAQAVTFAHACPVVASALQIQAQAASMPADCPDMAHHAASTRNACLSHCAAGDEVTSASDIVPVPVARLDALVVALADPYAGVGAPPAAPPSPAAAPPPRLRYARFLI